MPDSNNDKALASEVRKAAEELNSAVERARKEGLSVDYDHHGPYVDLVLNYFYIYRIY